MKNHKQEKERNFYLKIHPFLKSAKSMGKNPNMEVDTVAGKISGVCVVGYWLYYDTPRLYTP